jgi:hemolysin D
LQQIDSQLAVDRASLPGLRRQNDMAGQVIAMQDRLQKQNAASTLDVLRAQSNAVDVDLKLKSTQGEIEKLNGQRTEALQERQAYLDKWRSDHNHQLVQTRQDLSDARETLNKAQRMKDFTRLAAPQDGVVLEVADRSTGSVLREAETLLTMVPDGTSLYVEANVPSRDISYLKLGDLVRVKLEAYPFQRYGTLNGILDVISADAVPLKADDAKSDLVYKVQVRLTDNLGELARRGIRLRPGLVAGAEIKTGKRSIASYVLNLILRTADESLREP